MELARVTAKGQATIPKRIREAAHIREGDQLGVAMGHPARLLPCSPALLKIAGRVLGRSEQVDRLLGSLQVDSSKIRRELGWQPPFTLQEGLRLTVAP